ncbi:MAG: UvrD-helicase domain-containing protein [Spirochaetota bacterium]|nr:MAG: UvrD-helicase domain-containing protein [Spirochaetota bacterium]
MNWLCSFLDRYTLISNSDAHSPGKLGREANIFETELSYDAIIGAMRSGNSDNFLGTVEFFPQEGKYHYDGHRKCGICWNPLQTIKNNNICPVCGKKVTIGVMNRVMQLSDRGTEESDSNRTPYHSLIPLKEILSEITATGSGSKKVETLYHDIIKYAGSELNLLLNLPLDEIKTMFPGVIFEAVKRMREGDVYIEEGYDGEYGRIRVFEDKENESRLRQKSLFTQIHANAHAKEDKRSFIFDLTDYKNIDQRRTQEAFIPTPTQTLNEEQHRAKEHDRGPAIVLAGPGTGKTQILTMRIAWLIQNKSVDPKTILAITFTNRAANEMRNRVKEFLNDKELTKDMEGSEPVICTFHKFALSVLKNYPEMMKRSSSFSIIDEEQKRYILKNLGCDKNIIGRITDAISKSKQHLGTSVSEFKDSENEVSKANTLENQLHILAQRYESYLRENDLFDLDDLISSVCTIFSGNTKIVSQYRERFHWIMVDEYQDINYAQYRMIQFLVHPEDSNLFVIGDPNQAIYGFRGASVEFIRQFLEDYPQAAVYRLKKSYRCSNEILKGSQDVIQGKDNFDLEGLKGGVKISITKHPTDKSEAEWVARTIEKMMGGLRFFSIDSKISSGEVEFDRLDSLSNSKQLDSPQGLANCNVPLDSTAMSLSDFAVLTRIGRQMDVLKKAFNDHSIPFQEVSEVPFFEKEPVRSIIDLLKLSICPENQFLNKRAKEMKFAFKNGITAFTDLINKKISVKDKLLTIIENAFLKEREENEQDITMLLNLAGQYSSAFDLLAQVSLGTGADSYKPTIEAVSLLTIHSAKGLEFTTVFIVGCEEGLLPYSLYKGRPADFEEEKRLLYVGMTRARRRLLLSHASKRFLMGREYNLVRSPYLDSIEDALMESVQRAFKNKKDKSIQPDLF